MSVVARVETQADAGAIHAVNRAAFGVCVEADLVDRLRADGDLLLSLVAESGSEVIGYCGFSRLTVDDGHKIAPAVSLGPVAVLPAQQRSGVGQAMIREGIAQLKRTGETLIIVLGEPHYYCRFGFAADAAKAYRTPYDGPYLQALWLSGDAPARGAVRYAAAFAGL